jgi:hypothetical protein
MKTDWQEISKDLYEALVLVRKRSGLHFKDMETVFDATDAYEVAASQEDSEK